MAVSIIPGHTGVESTEWAPSSVQILAQCWVNAWMVETSAKSMEFSEAVTITQNRLHKKNLSPFIPVNLFLQRWMEVLQRRFTSSPYFCCPSLYAL